MPLIETKGAASAQGFGEFAQQTTVNYIEDVFSTYLYTGNGSTQTITNGIDLAGKGGMVWGKSRSPIGDNHVLVDSARGYNKNLSSNITNPQTTSTPAGISANSNGFSLTTSNGLNESGWAYASWTFRKQPKFFDIQTFSVTGGTGAATFSHNLGSTPGCIIIKGTDNVGSWVVYHRSLTAGYVLFLNLTLAQYTPGYTIFTSVTSTSVSVDQYFNNGDYVAYLFAHNAGGFGLSGSDNVISCGSYTGNGGSVGPDVNLGWEPQFVLVKKYSSGTAYDWFMFDMMRGMPVTGGAYLRPNLSNAEGAASGLGVSPYALGFRAGNDANTNENGSSYIYIAIRRGPMKVPTSGTSVFSPIATSAATDTALTTGFPVDMQMQYYRPGDVRDTSVFDSLRGVSSVPSTVFGVALTTSSTDAETSFNATKGWNNTGFLMPNFWGGTSMAFYNFRRAPGFFDEVCYTGTGATHAEAHNLTVAPELMIVKSRSAAGNSWAVYHSGIEATPGFENKGTVYLNSTSSVAYGVTPWNATAPTATQFTVGNAADTNSSSVTYVAYLFATCAGVSKVGSYTGTGALQTINCGFTGGARFVLIKRTDSTGDWYVYDSARGISSGNDPYLFLNSTAAEVTGTNYVDTTSVGFQVTAAAPAGLNANGGTYIFLAIA